MGIPSTLISREERQSAKPLAVPVRRACEILGVGNTTMWGLIKDERVKTIAIGRRRLVVYASLEALVE
jgi:hypothetical protein